MNKPIEIFKNAEAHYCFLFNVNNFTISFFNHQHCDDGWSIAQYLHNDNRLYLYDIKLDEEVDSPSVKQQLIDYLNNKYGIKIKDIGWIYEKQ